MGNIMSSYSSYSYGGSSTYSYSSNRAVPSFTAPDPFEDPIKPEEAEETNAVPGFKVLDVDLNKSTNKRRHHTDEYEHSDLIVRRGQEFNVEVKVDKTFEKGEDVIKLQFATGPNPLVSKGTMFNITPGEAIDPEDASAVIHDIERAGSGSNIQMKVSLPSDCPIGYYSLCVRLRNKEDNGNDRRFSKMVVSEKIIVLFNPWCKEDNVYVDDSDHIDEYVINQSGYVYAGERKNTITKQKEPKAKPWNFGQFDKCCLDAALYVLGKSDLAATAFGNPVKVSRCLTYMANSFNDNGILTGNWSGNYAGGTRPTEWGGSVAILEEFIKTKQAVNFGQCWVFSGLLTTLSRALGLPCRSVTNYSSAHDTDASMTIDKHQDEDGEPIKHLNDSIWNFHVWNEVWMKRPDLDTKSKYDGWQAFDATPQEESDGKYQCGPSPLAAIKEGNVHVGYDTKFILGEVNGDQVIWLVNELQEPSRVLKVYNASVGRNISTKAVKTKSREDVTDLYKYSEGSQKEERISQKIVQQSSRRHLLEEYYKHEEKYDCEMQFEGDVLHNGDVHIEFRVENQSQENRTVVVRMDILAKYYTGIDGDSIDKKWKKFKLGPLEKDELVLDIKGEDWLEKIAEDASIGCYCHAKVRQTKQEFIAEESFPFDKDELDVTVKTSTVTAWDNLEVTVKFTNPLDYTIKKGTFTFEGAGIVGSKVVQVRNIEAHATISETISVQPKYAGTREISVTFNSRQLTGIDGSVEFTVEKKE